MTKVFPVIAQFWLFVQNLSDSSLFVHVLFYIDIGIIISYSSHCVIIKSTNSIRTTSHWFFIEHTTETAF